MFDKQASSSSNACSSFLIVILVQFVCIRKVCYISVFHVGYFLVSMYLCLELVRFGDLYVDHVLFSV